VNPYLLGVGIGMAIAVLLVVGPPIMCRLYRGSIFYRPKR